MSKRMTALCAVLGSAVFCQAAIVFDATFDDATSGAVTGAGSLNAGTAVGSWSFQNADAGYAGGISTGTDKAAAFASDSNDVLADMSELDTVSVAFGTTYPETKKVDPSLAGVTKVIANFSVAGGLTGTQSTAISFDWGIFGTSNIGAFKHSYVRGLSSTGQEIFELLLVAGSGDGTRNIYARQAGDDDFTLTAVNAGTPEGVQLISSLDNGINSTTTTAPVNLLGVAISLANGKVTYGFERGTASGAALTYDINTSGATDIARLEFSEVWNSSVNTANKGFWLDDVNVTTIPEPATLGLIAAMGGSVLFIRRFFVNS